MKRNASALWVGNLREGGGQLTTDSHILDSTPYSFKTRFEEGIQGTNPEELIAAAHAGCFSMALSVELQKMNLKPEYIRTQASVNLNQSSEGFTIDTVHLTVQARVPGANSEQFEKAAEVAKAGCPVSRVLKAEITLEANLDHQSSKENLQPIM